MLSIFNEFSAFLNTKKIEYCVVGPVDGLPGTDGDIDVVLQRSAPYHDLILDFCCASGVVPVQCLRHEVEAYYYVLWDSESGELAKLDLCSDYVRNGRFLLSRQEILTASKPVSIGGVSCFVPAPEAAFLYYFIKKIDKLKLTIEQTAYLSALWWEAPETIREELSRFWSEPMVNRITDAAGSGNWSWVHENLVLLQRCLHQRTGRMSISNRIAEIGRVWGRLIRPTGLHVVFLGPDGCGKTSVIPLVTERVSSVFRRDANFHLFPYHKRNIDQSDAPVSDPQGQAPRGIISSFLKLCLWFLRYTGGWVVNVYPAKIRSTMISFDRYYHDLLVDPKRYRYSGPKWLAHLVGKLIPKPDLWILLDAPADVLQARKQEVTLEESQRQRRAYLNLMRAFPNAVVIDASQSLSNVVEECNRAVLKHLGRRMKRRLGG